MGIEQDAVVIYIFFIAICCFFYATLGLCALSGCRKSSRILFVGSIVTTVGAFFFLFNCYFQFDGMEIISDMTFGIGLFLISWAINLYCIVKLIFELQSKSVEDDSAEKAN